MNTYSRQVLLALALALLSACAAGEEVPNSVLPPKGEPGPESLANPPTTVGEQPPTTPTPPPSSQPPVEVPGEPEVPSPPSPEPVPPFEDPPEDPPQDNPEPPPNREPPSPPEDPVPPEEPEPPRREPPIEEQPAPPNRPIPPAAPNSCDRVDYQGACDGDVAVWCDNGQIARTHCGRRFGAACGWIDADTGFFCQSPNGYTGPQEPEPSPPEQPLPDTNCGQIDYMGTCDDHVIIWCQAGELSRLDCTERNQTCGWIDDSTGYFCVDRSPNEPELEPPTIEEQDGCGNIDAQGICDGDTAVWCGEGELRRFDCRAERQQPCGWVDDNLGNFCIDLGQPEPVPDPEPPMGSDPNDECEGINYQGICQGDVAVWCNSGQLSRLDCMAERGQACGWSGDDVGFYCIDASPAPPEQNQPDPAPPENGCAGLDFAGECAGDIARYCSNGQRLEVDCAANGTTCGWVDDDTGYYCQ